jgi:CPA2 family monovalent cation:H+ antiporter-2
MIVEALAKQSGAGDAHSLDAVEETLPGLGKPVAHRILEGSRAVGRSLGELDLRGLTGATVLAIRRGDLDIPFPTAAERFVPGDLVALAGTHDAITTARALLDEQAIA